MAPIPSTIDARYFYRCALQRYDEATILLSAGRSLGAMYLAGYAVECALKALLLAAAPSGQQRSILESFRGRRAHDYQWLREEYLAHQGPRFPSAVVQAFTFVGEWTTDLRYDPRKVAGADDADFVKSAGLILVWAKERF
jgi:hypothetical protein